MTRRLFALPSACRLPRVLCFLALAFALPVPAPAQGTGGAAEKINQDAGILFDQGRYADAVNQYNALLKGYPNSEYALEASFRLAYANFFLGQYQPAADGLRKLLASPLASPELKEGAGALLPQVLIQQASALPPEDATRPAAFEAAIKEYDNFTGGFPRSATLETAIYGRAVAEFQIERLSAAIEDLRKNLAAFPRSESILDSEFLLAVTLARQASESTSTEAKAAVPGAREAAAKSYEEAQKLLTDVVTKRTDLALANDAQFQLGEVISARAAGLPPGPARNALFDQALAAYRAVEPKPPMIAAQTARITRLRETRLAEARKGAAADRGALARLGDRLTREQGKLADLNAKPDPVLAARIRSGGVFFQLERYDETRVLMNALLPSATQADDQKAVLFYLAQSYINQKNIDKAVAAYNDFQSHFKGDPIAEGLPLAMGNMYLAAAQPDGARAEQYYDEFEKLYPRSNQRETVLLQRASSSASLGRYDEALAALDKFMAGNPKRELAAAAESVRASVQRSKRDLPGSLATYKKVRDTYAGLPLADEAAFWVGWTELQTADNTNALTDLKAFVTKFPQNQLTPTALVTLAQAQERTGAKDAALATLADVTTRFPDSPAATDAYFQRANIFLTDKKFDDLSRTLRDFVAKNPASERAYDAFSTIAGVQLQTKHPDEAAAAYEEFIKRQPQSPKAPEALAKLAALHLRSAREMGSYIVLGAPQRETWKAALNKSVDASERQLAAYPEAPATALGLQTLLDCQRLLTDAKVKTDDELDAYFKGLSDKYKDQPAARSRILLGLATLTAPKDPAKALAEMQEAYDPKVVYSPGDIDQYTQLLLKSDPKAAEAVLQKLGRDYPNPPGVAPAQAPLDVQEAQALMLYGRGLAAEAAGDKAKQQEAFRDLKKFYPQSSKVSDANLGLAEGLVATGKGEEALPLLSDVARSAKAPLETKAKGMLLFARIQVAKGSAPTAIDTFLKLAAFYPTTPQAPEALWEGAQALEKQAATLGDTPTAANPATKSSQLIRARKAYQDIVMKYPSSKWVEQAKDRAGKLPAGK